MSRRARRYEIEHASGRLTTTSGELFRLHVESGELLLVERRRARVLPGLVCYEEAGRLRFARSRELNGGDSSIPSNWEGVRRAWLYRRPFADPEDLSFILSNENVSTISEAYTRAIERGKK